MDDISNLCYFVVKSDCLIIICCLVASLVRTFIIRFGQCCFAEFHLAGAA